MQLAYEFHKEGELTAEELDEQYALIENHRCHRIQETCFRMKVIHAVLQITAGAGGTESCD
jgi:peptide chain release factor 2